MKIVKNREKRLRKRLNRDNSSDDWRYCMEQLEQSVGRMPAHVLERSLMNRSQKSNPSSFAISLIIRELRAAALYIDTFKINWVSVLF